MQRVRSSFGLLDSPLETLQAQRSLLWGTPTPDVFCSLSCPVLLSGGFGPGIANIQEKLRSEALGESTDDPHNVLLGCTEASGEKGMHCGAQKGAVLDQVSTCQKATEEFRREIGPANGQEVLWSWVGSGHRCSSMPSMALVKMPFQGRVMGGMGGWDKKEGALQFLWYARP